MKMRKKMCMKMNVRERERERERERVGKDDEKWKGAREVVVEDCSGLMAVL
ncbi:hypothetical protein HYC85_010289 [Camellia sinensis]|uniref:Uncharacterized protein n=1 Tax=Camellia sinensis TaxID=4442 RepID=A0A7J7HIF4_CAMSI|nr:hypothetical protein HYC85_010289 [Camellia sinensis]